MTYPQIFLILLERRLLREKEGSSLLVHAPITLLFPHFSVFLHFLSYSYVPSFLPYFLFLFFLSIFFSLVFPYSFWLPSPLPPFFLCVCVCVCVCVLFSPHCAQLKPFYMVLKTGPVKKPEKVVISSFMVGPWLDRWSNLWCHN